MVKEVSENIKEKDGIVGNALKIIIFAFGIKARLRNLAGAMLLTMRGELILSHC